LIVMNIGVQEGEADMKVVLFCGGYGTRMRDGER